MKELLTEKSPDLRSLLRSHRVTPTAQRIQIAEVLFARPAHFSAEDVYAMVNRTKPAVSKATVYNTLGLFVSKGLIREVLVDPCKVFYDTNIAPHHHFYDVDTGEIEDIDEDKVSVGELPSLPDGKELDRVEVLVRVRKSR